MENVRKALDHGFETVWTIVLRDGDVARLKEALQSAGLDTTLSVSVWVKPAALSIIMRLICFFFLSRGRL